jgi:hypothetical protein
LLFTVGIAARRILGALATSDGGGPLRCGTPSAHAQAMAGIKAASRWIRTVVMDRGRKRTFGESFRPNFAEKASLRRLV